MLKELKVVDYDAEVRAAANLIWRIRVEAGIPGDEKDDWFQAEQKVQKKYGTKPYPHVHYD